MKGINYTKEQALKLVEKIEYEPVRTSLMEKISTDWENIKFNYKEAYYWALNIGDKDVMIGLINNSEYAYYWASNIGDRELMRDKITQSYWAYCWARHIGDREIMRKRITRPEDAACWALNIGNNKIMRIGK